MKYGKWEVIRQLGEGGQGIAYLARDTTKLDLHELFDKLRPALRALVGAQNPDDYPRYARTALESIETYLHRESDAFCAVLKILHDHARGDSKARERLCREIDILGSLDHPNVIKIIDACVDEGWFVTPYYCEGTLAQHLRRWEGRPLEALEAFRSLVEGIAHLHKKSLVHRDIKPENIFVSDSRLVLGDFGIVYFEDNEKTRVSESYENVGSRDWMPPWAMGMRVDDVCPSFDVYSLGKVLWAMVSGRTKMRLWYWDRPEFDLTRQFPNDERMFWVNRLLERSVREYERDVHLFSSAREFLDQIERTLAILRRGGQDIERGPTRWCAVCRVGQYQLMINESDKLGLESFGIRPLGEKQFRIYRCFECGHVAVFLGFWA